MSDSAEREPFTTAIIGAGAVGSYHARALSELDSDIIIYEPDRERAEDIAGQYDAVVARCLEEAVEAADVVHVCSPPMLHMEGALASIEQGRPTIIEKPLTHDVSEAVEIYKAATALQVPLLVGMHYRLTPPFLSIKDGILRGEVGQVTNLETTYVHDMRKLQQGVGWRRGLGKYGFMYEGASHPVDLNMWLAGQPVTAVQATVSQKKLCPEYAWAEDHTYTFTYEDGTIGRVWSSAIAPVPRHGTSIEVYGADGAYCAHNKRAELMHFKDGDDDWSVTPTAPIGKTIGPMTELFQGFLRGERADFAPMPGIEEALRTMIVLRTIEQAAESGLTEEVPPLESFV